jgi:hypothetical protein
VALVGSVGFQIQVDLAVVAQLKAMQIVRMEQILLAVALVAAEGIQAVAVVIMKKIPLEAVGRHILIMD